MQSISRVSEMTGVSAHTLRYYERIGLLNSPERTVGGIREYSESDVRFIQFVSSLKRTGMSLEDITEFVKEGCIYDRIDEGEDIHPTIEKRIEILSKHIREMETRLRDLENIISLAKEKQSVYYSMLDLEGSGLK